ncbi:hypothetical protein CK203_063802 [Vitis vinifera]|uniref:Uncharacterized protein n=1 Tax=Vitis vinifera TaxID=29760 RepID=A0A438G817_VITVI|nr:hypothetical protein CK203_063802 [Vitis vinifera]
MLDETLQSHFKQPITAYTPPPIERKDRDDDNSSLPQFLTAACRTMMALPPPQHHYDKLKSLPTIKGDKVSDTIKRPSYSEKRYYLQLKRRVHLETAVAPVTRGFNIGAVSGNRSNVKDVHTFQEPFVSQRRRRLFRMAQNHGKATVGERVTNASPSPRNNKT